MTFWRKRGSWLQCMGKEALSLRITRGLLMEERKREIETELEEVIRKARVSGLSEEEIRGTV